MEWQLFLISAFKNATRYFKEVSPEGIYMLKVCKTWSVQESSTFVVCVCVEHSYWVLLMTPCHRLTEVNERCREGLIANVWWSNNVWKVVGSFTWGSWLFQRGSISARWLHLSQMISCWFYLGQATYFAIKKFSFIWEPPDS